jgi:DNA invertase Pin-like site-specific DNA recombinase
MTPFGKPAASASTKKSSPEPRRTHAGLTAARARGRRGGRPQVLNEQKLRMAQALRDDPSQSVQAICKALGISRTTFYRHTISKGEHAHS